MPENRTVAFVLYPGLTPLDLVGPLQVFAGLERYGLGYQVVTVAERLDPMGTDTSLRLAASHTFADVPAPFAVLVPGGAGPTFRALADDTLIGYLRQVGRTAELITSVCTGSLLLAEAGLLEGRRAATHWSCRHMLGRLGATPVAERWVDEGRVITAAGVSAGIDLALHLVERLAGTEIARLAQLNIEYDPQPPFGPIDWTDVDHARFIAWADRAAKTALADHPEVLERLVG